MLRILFVLMLQVVFSQSVSASDNVLMRLHGSNTVGAELGPELVSAWLYKQGYSNVQRTQLKNEEVEITAFNQHGIKKTVEIHSHGSSTAFKSLHKGFSDIGMSSRPIKEKENNRLKKYGDMTDKYAEYVIGLDGIAVIVNKQNSVWQLEKSLIKKIFTGKITRWNQLDKSLSGNINVYARDNKSGTYDTFKALVLGKKTKLIKTARRYESNDQLSDDVARDPLGIGFVGLPSVRNSKALAIAEKGSLAKAPKEFDVATEDYALARRLYLYAPDIETNKEVKPFIDFCLSEEGQSVVDRTGFISQNLRAQPVELNPGFPEEYLGFTENSQRLSLNFRFKKGSTKLDNKALRDIQRLSNYLAKDENKHRKVMLFGFADASETLPVFSLDLSTYRVDWVSQLLSKHGIDSVRVRAYGDAIPVASNEDAGGRHKNRRVEVWLR